MDEELGFGILVPEVGVRAPERLALDEGRDPCALDGRDPDAPEVLEGVAPADE